MCSHLVINLLIAMTLSVLVGARSIVTPKRADKTFSLKDMYQGWDFFSNWQFFTGPDPTDGNVNYLDIQDAMDQGLAYVDSDNTVVLAVDSTSYVPAGGNRNSVRITSDRAYTGGLFILDAVAMPVGCGTWPSFWTVGPNWPLGGEIDIIEGVNDQPHNQMTLHSGTSKSCTLTSSDAFTGRALGTNCDSTQNSDAGCGISVNNTTSFGHGFNGVQGGAYALLWDAKAGMSMWHFARADIPKDITNKRPTPARWGPPAGFWSAQTCDISANFYQHSMVIDTTICGGWAGSAYSRSGCPGTCSDMVTNATNFANAQWRINYVAVYQ